MSKYSKGFTFGLLSGALIGSVFAVLYAPDKGKNTRDKLSYRLSHYLDELNQLLKKLRADKQKYVSEAKEKGNQVIQDAQQKAEDLIAEAEDLLRSINESQN